MIPGLPTEIWTAIAEHVKREPPPAGEPGNWNEHFSQQDLTSLMRVNQTLYHVVSEVLYRAPVVQNFGLLLQGIEKPIKSSTPPGKPVPSTKRNAVLVHKRDLLGKIRKLHIIHASSRKPEKIPYMMTRGNGADLGTCEGDDLAEADLASWLLASDLFRRVDNPGMGGCLPYAYQNAFSSLESISFGAWDDGRWKKYKEEALQTKKLVRKFYESESEDSDGFDDYSDSVSVYSGTHRSRYTVPARKACPSYAIEHLLRRIFRNAQPIDICQNADAGINLRFGFKSSMKVIHNAPLDTALTGHARIYATTNALGAERFKTLQVGPLRLSRDRQMKFVFSQDARQGARHIDREVESDSEPEFNPNDYMNDSKAQELRQYLAKGRPAKRIASSTRKDIELCIVPEIVGYEYQLELARDLRDALEVYEKASQAKDGSVGYVGKFRIMVDGDIPACPCCGGRR